MTFNTIFFFISFGYRYWFIASDLLFSLLEASAIPRRILKPENNLEVGKKMIHNQEHQCSKIILVEVISLMEHNHVSQRTKRHILINSIFVTYLRCMFYFTVFKKQFQELLALVSSTPSFETCRNCVGSIYFPRNQ